MIWRKMHFLKNLQNSAGMNYFAGFRHALYFLSRSRPWQGRRILSLNYWLYWKSDFSGSFQNEPPKGLDGRARRHCPSLLSWHGETRVRICKSEARLPPHAPPLPSWVRRGLPPGSRRAGQRRGHFTSFWTCGEKRGHITSLRVRCRRRGSSKKRRALFERRQSDFFQLFTFFLFFIHFIFREGWEEPEHALEIFILVCATKTQLIPWGEGICLKSLWGYQESVLLRVWREQVFKSLWRECEK